MGIKAGRYRSEGMEHEVVYPADFVYLWSWQDHVMGYPKAVIVRKYINNSFKTSIINFGTILEQKRDPCEKV